MLYDEFVKGTNCKDNEHNYKVYKDLEIMYMNSDMTKADIYEYGKKLVDNSKSPQTIAFEDEINNKISALKSEIDICNKEIDYRKAIDDNYMLHYYTDRIKFLKNEIKKLKWVLS